jgi:hypothetical protein
MPIQGGSLFFMALLQQGMEGIMAICAIGLKQADYMNHAEEVGKNLCLGPATCIPVLLNRFVLLTAKKSMGMIPWQPWFRPISNNSPKM